MTLCFLSEDSLYEEKVSKIVHYYALFYKRMYSAYSCIKQVICMIDTYFYRN